MTVWLRLKDKRPIDNGWQLPNFQGLTPAQIEETDDVGMRLDQHVVVDCDNEEAKAAWLTHIGLPLEHTLVRKSPKGWHFIYWRSPLYSAGVSSHVPWSAVHPRIDLKAGMGHQVAYKGEGRYTLHDMAPADFLRDWIPPDSKMEWDGPEWSEMPFGMGDNAMFRFGCLLRRWGADEHTIAQCLAAIADITMTEQPMPLDTIRRLARQAAKHKPEPAHAVTCPHCEQEFQVL